jgi:DNA repair protein RadA/Sms
MSRAEKTKFVCNNCGQEFSRWQGKCFNCGQWETIVEFRVSSGKNSSSRHAGLVPTAGVVDISAGFSQTGEARIPTGFADMDRVLGGGCVPGGVVLLGGDPGIGKSTLLLQLSAGLAAGKRAVLYVSGEESAEQVAVRSERLGVSKSGISVLAETCVERAIAAMEETKPAVAVIDSIQTAFSERVESAPGSVSQVRECAAMFLRFAKEHRCAVFLVGHVTKDGSIAGPRVLEHMVDTVLYFEGDSDYQYRLLRAVKNRFGPSGEIAMFTMRDKGLCEVRNSAEFFLNNRETPQAGSSFVPVKEGSRIIVVELQALVNRTHFGIPQRVASGINPKKLSLVLAVLERYGGVGLGEYDIFFNVAGGLSITEPAADLGIAAAVLSSFRNKPAAMGVALLGEVGLGGEVRTVNGMTARLRELASMGFTKCIVPPPPSRADWLSEKTKIEFVELGHVSRIGDALFGR